MTNIGIVSLGCPKNRVDTENMLGILGNEGFGIVANPEEADIIIVNTCGFIDAAKEESIATVLEMAEFKKKKCKLLIMAGCLAERYSGDILAELPEVDAVVGTGDYHKIAEVIKKAQSGEKPVLSGHIDDEIPEGLPRILSTGSASAYLKIADGCDNKCTYCVIPKLRGKYRSRPMEDILSEAEALAKEGVRELIVIAQDTTRYGYDLYGEEKLSALLTRLCQIEAVHWVRVHYMYPESITDSMIEVFAANEKLVNYMDIPIQHINDRILKLMGRKTTKEQITNLIEKLRSRIPDLTLRTSLIAGFPSETEEEFSELLEFIKSTKFERLGVFAYSQEENTAAARLPEQLEESVKIARQERAMEAQNEISAAHQRSKIGKTVEVLTEGYDEENLMYFGRCAADSIEVDTTTFFAAEDEVLIGSFVKVKILDADSYDCTGVQVE
ncbi:30S ribosomal protein S12 methylthiotransferase RimO [Congzhengia minquanensis]|jgi:ribosomal protein S12 methylthiotransferase|uniref:Ribosomal protein uS12 methylthiotransferase RimO n=1 Tax=Congzhengia minquanensis TaxID=2763657 RepID=A0A926DN74_9FIRM|nr:30S ribosomal protein S12 methylthiotransferase RimO [Congzhengia minquanensis]MBC8540941.1 30S ribosomal protein S12 methylthiotransferase RimO [Congzhengia minquanensis]